jgi:hypothetical protein
VGLYKKEEHGRGDEAFRADGGGNRPGMGKREGGLLDRRRRRGAEGIWTGEA